MTNVEETKNKVVNTTANFFHKTYGKAYKTNAFFFYIIFFSLSMFVRFPCQNFMSLLVDQQNTIKYLFKTNLLRLVSSTSPLNIGVLQLQKVSHQFIAWILILCSCVIWD